MLRKAIGIVGLALVLGGCDAPPPYAQALGACRSPLVAATMIELYFGRVMPGGGVVSEAQWSDFLRTSITPRFPDGLTVLEGYGQSGGRSGRITGERVKVVQLGVRDPGAAAPNVDAVIGEYRQRFNQTGVFRVERAICASL